MPKVPIYHHSDLDHKVGSLLIKEDAELLHNMTVSDVVRAEMGGYYAKGPGTPETCVSGIVLVTKDGQWCNLKKEHCESEE